MSNFLRALKHLSKRLSFILGIVIISVLLITTLIISIAYVLTPQLTRYHPQLVAMLSNVLQHPVTVEEVSAEWEGLGPVVQLHNVQIWDATHKAEVVGINDVEVRVSIFDLVRKRALVPRAILLDNPQARLIQTPEGQFQVVGFNGTSNKKIDVYEIVEKIIALDDIQINDADIEIQLANGETTFIKNADVRLNHGRWRTHLELSGTLMDTVSHGKLTATAIFSPRALAEKQWRGDLTLTLNSANLTSWMQLWPQAPITIESGIGDITVETSWDNNELIDVYTALALAQLTLQAKNNAVSHTAETMPLTTIELTSLTAKVQGKKNIHGWNIAGDSAVSLLSGGDISAYGNMQLMHNIADSHVELYAQGNDIPAVDTLDAYLPENKTYEAIPAGLVRWLHQAIRGGNVDTLHMVLRGPLKEFPFIEQPNEQDHLFEINMNVADGDLQFHQSWLPLKNIQGNLIFRGNEFFAIIDKGEIAGETIQQAAIVIPEVKRQGLEVDITGKVNGTAENTVVFLQQSPLWEKLKDQLSPLVLTGPAQVEIDLTIPITEPRGEQKILGAIDFAKTSVAMPALDLNFTQVEGKLTFNHAGIYADNLTALFYDKPVTAQIATQVGTAAGEQGFTKIAMQGDISMASLQQRYPSSMWSDWTGGMPFAAEVEWHKENDKNPSRLNITSNLKGLNVNLPAPFGKPATQEEAFIYKSEFGGGKQHQQVQYGKLLNADLYFTKKNNQSELTRGLVQIQPTGKMTVPANGLQVVGNLATLDLDNWVPRIQGYASNGNAAATSFPAVSGKLQTGTVKILGQNLAINTINLQRTSQQWNINFSGNDARGQALVPHQLKQKPINLSMDYLKWKTDQSGKPYVDKTPPDNLPDFNVDIKKLSLNDVSRGSLKLSTKMGNKSLTINPLRLQDTNYALVGTSQWTWPTKPSRTTLNGTITTQNLGGMLDQWGLTKGMQGGKGTTKLNLNWEGGPSAWSLDNLQGEMIVDWHNGRLTEVNPGFGRILALLNLNIQGISRRLRLDFSDVFKQGLTFDKITSDMIFKPGVINTKNGEIDSSAGKITFNGNAYTITKTLDLYVEVTPNIPSSLSLPIAAVVAIANPIAGAAVWAGEKAVSPAISKTIGSKRYHVTGPWQDPIINETKGKSTK